MMSSRLNWSAVSIVLAFRFLERLFFKTSSFFPFAGFALSTSLDFGGDFFATLLSFGVDCASLDLPSLLLLSSFPVVCFGLVFFLRSSLVWPRVDMLPLKELPH